VSSDPQPAATAHVEESEDPLNPELKLAVTFEVLHRLKVAAKSRLLSMEELDLIEFLVAHVASLSSSLACKAATIESPAPPPEARQVVFPQSDPSVPYAHRHAVGDVSATIVRSSTPPSVALELHAIGAGESCKAKPPDIAALESGCKGSALRCTRWSARLAAKCRGGTFTLPAPRRCLPNKVVLKRRLACPRPCPCVPFVVAPPSVVAALLLLFLPVALDVTSSQLRSCGAVSGPMSSLLVHDPCLSPLFYFFFFFSFVLELGAS
jgi:hypothetical protein